MGTISMDNILFTFGIFALLAIAFGQTIPSVDVQSNINNLFAPPPSFQQTVQALSGPNKGCGSLDFGCQASAGLSSATAYIGATIGYPGILAGFVISKITSFGNLISFVTFGSSTGLLTIPFGNLFLLALVIVVAVGLFRLVRGNSPGL